MATKIDFFQFAIWAHISTVRIVYSRNLSTRLRHSSINYQINILLKLIKLIIELIICLAILPGTIVRNILAVVELINFQADKEI